MTIPSPSGIDFPSVSRSYSRRSRGHTALALAFSAGLLLDPSAARADALTAEALFQSGREALEKGDTRAACDRFQESYRLDPTAGTALNLGNCRERLGQLASAWQRYEEAVQKLPEGDKRVAVAQSHAAQLLPKIPHLTLIAPPGAADFVVMRDGEQLGRASLGLALPVDPGTHAVVVHAPGHDDWSRDIALAEGQQLSVPLELGSAAENQTLPVAAPVRSTASTAAPPPAPANTAATSTAGWVLAGVGVAGIATSLVAGAVVLSKKSTVESSCVDKHCSGAGLDAAQTGRTFSTIGTVAFGVGAAALGVGVYLILTRAPGPKKEQARLARPATRLGASATNGGLQLRLESSF